MAGRSRPPGLPSLPAATSSRTQPMPRASKYSTTVLRTPSTEGAWGLMTMPALRTLFMADRLLDPGWDGVRVEVRVSLDPPGEEFDIPLLPSRRAADETLRPEADLAGPGHDTAEDLGVDRSVPDDAFPADVPGAGL